MIDIWRLLAEGPPIDDQRALRQAAAQVANAPVGTSDVVPPCEDSDEDAIDPYHARHVASGSSGDPYADLEDDDDEY